jgi:hypothetical protein
MSDAEAREREFDRHRKINEEAATEEAAWSMAGQPQTQQGQARLIELLGNPDVDPDVKAQVETELSRLHMFANISEEEWDRRQPLHRNKADRMKAEHPGDTGPGSKCTGEVRRIMTNEDEEKGALTPERARGYDGAMETRASAESLAIGGKAFDGVTRIYAITGREEAEDGAASSARSTLASAGQAVKSVIKRD